jgi:hypothetical protein
MTILLYCATCGKPCDWKRVDCGIGPYEFWGQKCIDTNVQVLSECCEDDIFTDPELTISYEHEDHIPEDEHDNGATWNEGH